MQNCKALVLSKVCALVCGCVFLLLHPEVLAVRLCNLHFFLAVLAVASYIVLSGIHPRSRFLSPVSRDLGQCLCLTCEQVCYAFDSHDLAVVSSAVQVSGFPMMVPWSQPLILFRLGFRLLRLAYPTLCFLSF